MENKGRIKKIVLTTGLAALILTAMAVCEDSNATVSPEKRVAYINSPAVVMVKCMHWGTLVNRNGESKIFLYLGNDKEKTEVALPDTWMGGTGSGFIVSQDGYIVTNAHVVYETDDQIKEGFVQQYGKGILYKYPELKNGLNSSDEIYDILRKEYTLKKGDAEIRIYFGGSSAASSQAGYPAEVRTESPKKIHVEEGYRYASGKDIAILKVEGLKNLPTVILGDSDRMEVGDKVIVIGYPYLVKSDAAGMVILSPETDLLPTVTSGIISAKRKSPDGSEVFQIDAPIQHGNSGGPAFNDKGEVIGIATWGSFMELPTSEGYSESELYNFLVPIDVAKSFINQLNINTVPSATIRRFENGLDYYWMGQYSQAEKEFNGILATNPNNYYAAEYLQMVNQRSS